MKVYEEGGRCPDVTRADHDVQRRRYSSLESTCLKDVKVTKQVSRLITALAPRFACCLPCGFTVSSGHGFYFMQRCFSKRVD